jgi:hypothetical protein
MSGCGGWGWVGEVTGLGVKCVELHQLRSPPQHLIESFDLT